MAKCSAKSLMTTVDGVTVPFGGTWSFVRGPAVKQIPQTPFFTGPSLGRLTTCASAAGPLRAGAASSQSKAAAPAQLARPRQQQARVRLHSSEQVPVGEDLRPYRPFPWSQAQGRGR